MISIMARCDLFDASKSLYLDACLHMCLVSKGGIVCHTFCDTPSYVVVKTYMQTKKIDVLEPISFGLRKFALAVDKGIKKEGKVVIDRTLRDQIVKKLFTENVTLRRKTCDRDLNKSVEVLKKDNDVLKLCNVKQSRMLLNLKQENMIQNQLQHECVICFESIRKPGLIKILECGHAFHDECIKLLSKCPLDRSVV